MTTLKILGGEKKLSVSDLEKFESDYGIELPGNYRTFMIKHNGGYIDSYHEFLGSFRPIKYGQGTVEHAIQSMSIHESILDSEFIPIANHHAGNPITLCVRSGELYGKIIIFYFDRDEEPEIVANSLEELLGVKSIDEL